jgi:hypothetical protein
MIDGGLWNVFEPIPGAELADQWADVHAAVQSALALQPVSDALVLQARQGFMDSVSAQ